MGEVSARLPFGIEYEDMGLQLPLTGQMVIHPEAPYMS